MTISLTWPEVWMAAQQGAWRQLEALSKGLADAYGFDGADGWSKHIEGAAGEVAFAKVADRFWAGSVNTFKTGGDVGDIQVRTRSRKDYDLIVRPDDRDDDVFVLLIGKSPLFDVAGWILGRDAKRDEWRKEYGGRPAAFFVPRASLRPMEELKR